MASVIVTENLSKSYRKKKISHETFSLNNLNLNVEEGEIYGFLGPNGAGKTTTIKLLLGFIHADQGTITMMGEPVSSVSVRQKIGFLPEIAYYYKFLKAGELLDAYARLFHIETTQRRIKIQSLLEKVGLKGQGKTYLREFSKGMLQRLSLAQALLNDPQLLILDEPTSGLDPIGRREIREIILDLHKKGVTIFFSSHELSAVELISTHVGILNKGKLVREGRPKDLLPPLRKMNIKLSSFLSAEAQTILLQKIKTQLSPDVNSSISFGTEDNQTLIVLDKEDYIYPVLRIMEQEKMKFESIFRPRGTLEDVFVETVKGK
jgi:ABC-2 type transport system ATP-binding protein